MTCYVERGFGVTLCATACVFIHLHECVYWHYNEWGCHSPLIMSHTPSEWDTSKGPTHTSNVMWAQPITGRSTPSLYPPFEKKISAYVLFMCRFVSTPISTFHIVFVNTLWHKSNSIIISLQQWYLVWTRFWQAMSADLMENDYPDKTVQIVLYNT